MWNRKHHDWRTYGLNSALDTSVAVAMVFELIFIEWPYVSVSHRYLDRYYLVHILWCSRTQY